MTTEKVPDGRKMIFVAFAAIAAMAAVAADDEFPNSDGTGNLMSDDAWGGAVSANRMKITEGGTYYFGKNGTVNGLCIGTTGTVTFDQSKCTETDPCVTMGGNFDIAGAGRTVVFRGGTYDFKNNHSLAYGGYNSYKNNKITLDGCVMTNIKTGISFTYVGKELTEWTLENNSILHTKGYLKPDYSGNGKVHLNITGGSKVLTDGELELGKLNNTGDQGNLNQKIIVSGVGSFLKFGDDSNSSILGDCYSDALLEVRDGARVEQIGKECLVGNRDTASNNVIRVTGTGTTANLNSIAFGSAGRAHHNRVEALDGATVEIKWVVFHKGEANGLVCSNATLSIDQLGQEGDYNSYVRVQGNKPKVTLSSDGENKKYSMLRDFRLIFDLPPDGYKYEGADDCPVKALGRKEKVVDDTTVVEINGIKEYQKSMKRRGVRKETIKLAYLASNDYWGPLNNNDRIAKWNADLPEGAELSRSGDGDLRRTLYLTVKAVNHGMCLIIR